MPSPTLVNELLRRAARAWANGNEAGAIAWCRYAWQYTEQLIEHKEADH